MPPRAAARKAAQRVAAESDEESATSSASASEGEVATKPTANKRKAKVATVPASEDDSESSFDEGDSSRSPLKSVNGHKSSAAAAKEAKAAIAAKAKRRISARVNGADDALRRQSFSNNARLKEASQASLGSDDSQNADPQHPPRTPKRVVSNTIAALARGGARLSLGGGIGSLLDLGQGGAPGSPAAPVSAEVRAENYEEWMKLATDNVSLDSPVLLSVLMLATRKSIPQTHGTLLSSTTFTKAPSFATLTAISRSIFRKHRAP